MLETPTPIVRVWLDGRAEPGFDLPFRAAHGTTADGKVFYFPRIDDTSDVWIAENFDPDVP